MLKTSFLSKEVNPERLKALISFTIIALILILILGLYYYYLVDISLIEEYMMSLL